MANKIMPIWKIAVLGLVLSFSVLLPGCNPPPQDGSGIVAEPLFGLVLDGRVANALVWVDRNNNGKLDNFEPNARTDKNGFFSHSGTDPNAEDFVNYCNLPSTDVRLRHCLRYGSSQSNVRIMVQGGIDLDTGEPLSGIMVLSDDLESLRDGERPIPIISPLTTLVASLNDPSQLILLRDALFSDADDEWLRRDFSQLTSLTSSSENLTATDAEMLTTGILILKLRELVFSLESDGFDRNSKQAQDAFLGAMIATLALNSSSPWSDWGFVELLSVLGFYEESVQSLRNSDSLPIDINQISGSISLSINQTRSILNQVDQLSDSDRNKLSASERSNRTKVILRTAKIIHEINLTSIETDTFNTRKDKATATAAYFTDPNNLAALQLAITGNDVSLSSLARDLAIADLDSLDLEREVANHTIQPLPEDTQWANTWRVFLPVNYTDELSDGSFIAIYLTGRPSFYEPIPRNGTVSACVNGSLIDDNTNSVEDRFINGSWLVLGKAQSGRIALSLSSGALQQSGTLQTRSDSEFVLETIEDNKRYTERVILQETPYLSSFEAPQNQSDCVALGNAIRSGLQL